MATGTMRNDRIMKCPLIDVKKMNKNERGSFDFRSDGNIEIVRWNDNSAVTTRKISEDTLNHDQTIKATRHKC